MALQMLRMGICLSFFLGERYTRAMLAGVSREDIKRVEGRDCHGHNYRFDAFTLYSLRDGFVWEEQTQVTKPLRLSIYPVRVADVETAIYTENEITFHCTKASFALLLERQARVRDYTKRRRPDYSRRKLKEFPQVARVLRGKYEIVAVIIRLKKSSSVL